jgi:hypothetical protein
LRFADALARFGAPLKGILDDLIVTKRAAGRLDDLIAIRKLEERQRRK